jgi:hypothetical protein
VKLHVNTRRWLVSSLLVLIMIVGSASPAFASGYGVSRDLVYLPAPISIGYPCEIKQPDHTSLPQGVSSFASNTLCRLYVNTASTARSLFSGVDPIQYLPWAPTLVGLVLLSFLALAAWCAWKMKDYRPHRKYHIGRTI